MHTCLHVGMKEEPICELLARYSSTKETNWNIGIRLLINSLCIVGWIQLVVQIRGDLLNEWKWLVNMNTGCTYWLKSFFSSLSQVIPFNRVVLGELSHPRYDSWHLPSNKVACTPLRVASGVICLPRRNGSKCVIWLILSNGILAVESMGLSSMVDSNSGFISRLG